MADNHSSAGTEDGPGTPDEALDLLMHEAGWIDMHGGDRHEDDCPVCRSIAIVRAALNHAYPPSHAGGTFTDAQQAEESDDWKALAWDKVSEAHVKSRAKTIEECAKVAAKQIYGWVNGEATTAIGRAYQRGCTDAAVAIRSLASQPSPAATVEIKPLVCSKCEEVMAAAVALPASDQRSSAARGSVCCYCDAPLACEKCGHEQPDDSQPSIPSIPGPE